MQLTEPNFLFFQTDVVRAREHYQTIKQRNYLSFSKTMKEFMQHCSWKGLTACKTTNGKLSPRATNLTTKKTQQDKHAQVTK